MTEHLEITDRSHPNYFKIAKNPDSDVLVDMALNRNGDALYAHLSGFAKAVINPNWHVYAAAENYQLLIEGTDVFEIKRQLNASAFMGPEIFDGFNRVIVAAACFKGSMMYQLWATARSSGRARRSGLLASS